MSHLSDQYHDVDKMHYSLDDQQAFPTEVLMLIVSFVREKNTLLVLCQVSKTFRGICMPLLYNVVHIRPPWRPWHSSKTQTQLYQTLQTRSIAHGVTDLCVELDKMLLCELWDVQKKRPQFLRRCVCDGHDRALGEAILSLTSLQALAIICRLCYKSHSHTYLFKLDSPTLRKFTFYCHGSTVLFKNRGRNVNSLLLAPFMSRITALQLDCEEDPPLALNSVPYEQLLQGTDNLSNLCTLSHNGSALCDLILSRRRVQRLSLVGWYSEGHKAAIRKGPGRLTHLFGRDVLHWLLREIALDIGPYRQLRYIGTVKGIDPEAHFFRELEALSPLSSLEVIEISRERVRKLGPNGFYYFTSLRFSPDSYFMKWLGDRHPHLRRVLLTVRDHPLADSTLLWEKNEVWTSRKVPQIEYWDILCDKLDTI